MTEPLTDDEWVQFALWAHRNPEVAKEVGTLRLMARVNALTDRAVAAELRVDELSARLAERYAESVIASIPPATDPPREAEDSKLLDFLDRCDLRALTSIFGMIGDGNDVRGQIAREMAVASNATDPPRETVQKAELDAIHERFWSSVAPEAVHPDSVRLDWLAWDNGNGPVFDALAGFDVHDHADEYQDERTAYCAAFRTVIDAAMQAPQAQEAEGR
jgi:hypothetical protein